MRLIPAGWKHHPALDWLITLLCAQILLSGLHHMMFGSSANLRLYDSMLMQKGYTARSDIVVVGIDDRTLEELGGWPLKRRHYAQLLQRMSDPANQPKAIGLDLLFIDATDDDAQLAHAMKDLPVVLPAPPERGMETTPSLAHAVKTYGHIQLNYDLDGISRSIPHSIKQLPHMALAMVLRSGDPKAIDKVKTYNQRQTSQRFRMVDPEVGFTTISLSDVQSPYLASDIFKDKWILIGLTSSSLGDNHSTIYSGINGASTPGIYIVASILNEALNDQWINVLPDSTAWILGAIFLTLISLLLFWSNPSRVFVLTAAALTAICVIDYVLLSRFNIWINIVPCGIVISFMGGFWSWRRLMTTVSVIKDQLGKTQHSTALQLGEAIPEPSSQPTFDPFTDQTHRVVKKLNTAIELQTNDLQLLNNILQQIPAPVAIFDINNKHLISNQAMNSLARKLNLATNQSTHYDFEQLISALKVSTSRATSSSKEEIIVSLSQYNLPNLYFVLETSEIQSADSYKLKLITLTDITANQRHQIQREQTLQFLSHDMRTPIATILALKKRLLQLPVGNMPQVQTCAEQISQSAQRLMDMMDGFIVHSQAQEMPLHLTSCLLSDLLDDAIEQAQPLAEQHQVQLQLIETHSLLRVMVDTHLVIRALLNLLHNAIRHGVSGSQVTIRTSIHHDQKQSMARIEILNPIGNLQPLQDIKGFGLGLKFVKTTTLRHEGKFHMQIPYRDSVTPLAWIALDIPLAAD